MTIVPQRPAEIERGVNSNGTDEKLSYSSIPSMSVADTSSTSMPRAIWPSIQMSGVHAPRRPALEAANRTP
jgi:hypothetical protein